MYQLLNNELEVIGKFKTFNSLLNFIYDNKINTYGMSYFNSRTKKTYFFA